MWEGGREDGCGVQAKGAHFGVCLRGRLAVGIRRPASRGHPSVVGAWSFLSHWGRK